MLSALEYSVDAVDEEYPELTVDVAMKVLNLSNLDVNELNEKFMYRIMSMARGLGGEVANQGNIYRAWEYLNRMIAREVGADVEDILARAEPVLSSSSIDQRRNSLYQRFVNYKEGWARRNTLDTIKNQLNKPKMASNDGKGRRSSASNGDDKKTKSLSRLGHNYKEIALMRQIMASDCADREKPPKAFCHFKMEGGGGKLPKDDPYEIERADSSEQEVQSSAAADKFTNLLKTSTRASKGWSLKRKEMWKQMADNFVNGEGPVEPPSEEISTRRTDITTTSTSKTRRKAVSILKIGNTAKSRKPSDTSVDFSIMIDEFLQVLQY